MRTKISMKNTSLVPVEQIQKCIYVIRGRKVMLDSDLAGLYGVATKVLLQAVKRNIERFPPDFMFQLSTGEFKILRSQFVTSSWGGRRYAPCAFTEQGVAMLSSVLRSKRAIEINIAIMRVFVHLRQVLADNAALRKKLEEHDEKIKYIFNLLGQMLQEPEKPKKRIGYLTEIEGAQQAPPTRVVIVSILLRKLNIRYHRNVKSIIGQPDLVIYPVKTVIFVHGCFWHNHANCKRAKLPTTNRAFWKQKILGNKRRDNRITRLLRKQGWRVITVWQCSLHNENRVFQRLYRLLSPKT